MGTFAEFKRILTEAGVRNLTAVNLQTREHNFGVILFPHAERRAFGSSGPRLMVGLALQLGLTLENYVVSHDAHRRTKEYELLTEIGKAISSRLDQDEILRTIQVELGQIFDTSHFYIAFQEARRDPLRAGSAGQSRTAQANARIAKRVHRIRDPQRRAAADPLRSGERRASGWASRHVPKRPAKCLIAAPIFLGNQACGNHGRDESRPGVRLRTARPGRAGDGCGAGFGRGRKCAPVRRRAAPFAATGISQQRFPHGHLERRSGAHAGPDRERDSEELQFRPHRHRVARLRNKGSRDQGRGWSDGPCYGQANSARDRDSGARGADGRTRPGAECAARQSDWDSSRFARGALHPDYLRRNRCSACSTSRAATRMRFRRRMF